MATNHRAKHLLVADDVPDIAAIVAEFVVDSRPEVSTEVAFDGAQAVALATSRPPACAILDIDMPVMNGIDAAVVIRDALSKMNRLILLVAMTGDPRHARNPRAVQAFDHILFKPVDLKKLIELVDKA